uniref:Uncharacterized protein n=1 Tax=Rhizophora mucronata TaxID=61149 RepID=A0A2P2M1R8_RHIMU
MHLGPKAQENNCVKTKSQVSDRVSYYQKNRKMTARHYCTTSMCI